MRDDYLHKDDLVKAGEFMGCPIYIDTSMSPYEAKMISLRWDEFTRRLVIKDEVRVINLRASDDA